MLKNFKLLFLSIFFSILLIEVFLRSVGLYSDLADATLEPSISIYEKPKNSIQKRHHPDVFYVNENYFDFDGVKNNTKLTTSKKKNIIGIFGDSFVENYLVDPKFDFANILNRNIINYEVVNYGVGGYQAEQAFLRYFKNKDHDLKYVFYFFMLGDQESYKLLTFTDNNQYAINKVKINPIFQMLGKLNITYLSIDAFLKLRILIYNDYSSIKKNNYPELMANQIANKNKIGGVFDINHFAQLIETFQKTVESNNAEFFVILYPNKDHINYFQESIKLRNLKVNYFVLDNSLVTEKKFKFKNDDHWNEFGNLHFARNIKNFLNTNLKIIFENDDNYQKIEKEIDSFYSLHKPR
jgi:hypothetical protein